MSWKLNFCRRETKLINNQRYIGNNNVSDQASICRLSKYVGLGAKVSAKEVYRRDRAVPPVWLEPQAKTTLEVLQISLTRRRMLAGLSSCVECHVGSMAPLIWQIL
jgi:hypothetical protein